MRRISLASRFVFTLVVTAVLPLLLYGWFSLRSMREQIDEQVVRVFLPQLAADHAQKIDGLLQRVDQACAIVREIARRALDSRAEMAAFEEQVELVPDLLDNYLDLLLLADSTGRVVYWQDGQRLDPNTHERRAALIPTTVADAAWFRGAQRERTLQFVPWGRSPFLHRGLEHRSMDPASHHLGLAIDVPRPEGPPGVLFALLRWGEVQLVLDQARDVLAARAGLPSAQVLLASRDGRVLAHTDRARYGLPLAPPALAAQVTAAKAMARGAYAAADGARWRVGVAPCGLGGARDFVVAVTVPETELFAASDAFEQVLLVAIAVTLAVLVLWSLVASRAIVAPVRALVAATRRVAGGDLAVSVPARGGPELGELASAFNQMATELAQGRQRLVAVEREQAWAEMARQVAHEVKNPLQPMRMAAQLLQRARRESDPRADAVADRLARTVLEQTQALDRIASDFRAFAGSAPAQRTPVRLDDWLAELRDQCAGLFAGKALELTFAPGAGDAAVALDSPTLARVFVNLVQNAIEAAPNGVAVALRSSRADGRAVVEIADDGPGVPDEARGHLFEPYFTTKSSGTGLGLAICRRVVEAHGGAIRLDRTRAGETVFTIELPVAPPPTA
ncbi:MAG: HAMP domain-containing histidine kinase [Planctomycetes bacterium]|nr:HAMP domain-containing histidine kinase [Planctomycetota bacterium]